MYDKEHENMILNVSAIYKYIKICKFKMYL